MTLPTFNSPPEQAPDSGQYVSRAELDAIFAQHQAQLDEIKTAHEAQLKSVAARLPVAQVPANGGGPGIDNHQVSWSLAEQEIAARGETLEKWSEPVA